MPKPITPLASCDVFVLNEKEEVLLIQRSDNGRWALPGGCHDLGETPNMCAERECFEESGFRVRATGVLGVYSSNCYKYVYYPYKDNEFCHLVFTAKVVGGEAKTSSETTAVGWFAEGSLPPLSDGHDVRIAEGFAQHRDPLRRPHFE